MTIHSDHPFQPPEGERDQLRRFRAHLPAPVTVWAAGSARSRRAGLTVSSVLVADGKPGRVVGLVDEDSDLAGLLPSTDTFTVNALASGGANIAEVFAGLAPSPGGPFRTGKWDESNWGPVLADSAGWLGVRLSVDAPRHVGWALMVEGIIEHIEVRSEDALSHIRATYR